MVMDEKMKQQLSQVLIGVVTIFLMYNGYSNDQIATMAAGIAGMLVGVFALYTESPKKQQ
jgi:succinate-acetate transporter protein